MRLLLGLSLVLFVAGCTPIWQTKPSQTPEQLWQQRLLQQAEFKQWAFKGRTAIVQGREGWNAGIDWIERSDSFQIKLSGPFSQGGVALEGDSEQVTLTMDNGETLSADTPERLLAEAMGWLLPVSALRDWVRGVPFDKVPVDNKELDEQGRLTKLEQAGWHIEFLRYVPFKGTSMPAKVFMKHPDLNVRLVVSAWRIPN